MSGRPATPAHGALRVIENREVASETFLLVLDASPLPAAALPGQFFMLSFDGMLDPLLPRPFAAFDRQGDRLAILYRRVGKGTGLLAQTRPGARLQALGPLGRGYRTALPPGARALILAGGIGFASVCLLLKELLAREHPVTLLYGTRAADQMVPLAPDLAGHPGLTLHRASEDGAAGFAGNVHEMYRSLLRAEPDFQRRHHCVYACGPVPMLRAFARTLGGQGVPAQFSLEANMACGYGVCQGCAVPVRGSGQGGAAGYRKVCVDGPVFAPEDLNWDAMR